jgi:ABC-2 type transport system permease protein
MSLLRAELRLILRSRLAAASLALLFAISALSIWSGLSAVDRQEAMIARVTVEQARDLAAVARDYGKPDGEAGYAAYYSFLLTYDRPSPVAFLALGQRDVQPAVLRVRALSLQQQLYESETLNAEQALPGVFDFAFVAIYLAPLVVIALTHDLVTGEREGGRLRLLLSMPGTGLWRRRIGLRYLLVALSLLIPAGAALIATAAPVRLGFGIVTVTLVYLAFWFGLSVIVACRARASAAAAAASLGCWIALTLLLPTLANTAITRAVPVSKGIDLTLAQREIVHHGWDIPKPATFDRFLATHPEWRGHETFEGRFHWKWLFAMHQVGDEAVAPQVAAYRESLLDRERWTTALGWLLPNVAAQGILHRLADTDLIAQLDYQDSIGVFHKELRTVFYPYLFLDRPFTRADFDRLPRYAARSGTASWPALPMLMLLIVTGLILTAAAIQMRRIGRDAAR